MNKEFPCVYYEGGICKFYTTEDITSYCIEGPCHRQKLSNGGKIRAISDNELAEFLCGLISDCSQYCPGYDLCNGIDGKANGLKAWLKREAKDEDFV